MEKEMKKLLLVAVSVGVFLLVTITAAIMVLTPGTQTQEAAFSSSAPISQGRINEPQASDRNDITRDPVIPQPVIEGPQTVAIIDRNNGDSVTIQVPSPSTAAVPETRETAAPAARTPVAAVRTAAPAAASNTAPRPAASSNTAARPASARTINDFWIQIGAYSSMVRAEDAKEILSTKGLTSIIETRVVDGRNLFRVRLGPYTSQREANHWLDIVKTINGFQDSQIRQTSRQQ